MLQALSSQLTFSNRLLCAIVVLSCFVGACADCPESQRPRAEAAGLAIKFAQESFRANSNRSLNASDLRILGERYQQEDRAWYFQIGSTDNQCLIDVAVPDCAPTESAGGGGCSKE